MNKERFRNLQHLNLILTNACNKTCDYCYEQHDKTDKLFTVETLKESYEFLKEANKLGHKRFQFFGGEPLIHKKLILDFMRENKEEIEANDDIVISMCTNGTLLTDKFIEEYYSYKNTQILISLDSHKADVEHRHTSSRGVNKILDYCYKIVQMGGDVAIRCTLSLQTLPYLEEFIDVIKNVGVREMIVHPLTLSKEEGFIEWPKEDWAELTRIMKKHVYDDDSFIVHFSEGVGTKDCGSNCMVGENMIAMDGSGDFSGCYFFTNQKEALPETLLGNVFEGTTYEERYDDFEREYEGHFVKDPKCSTCDLQNYCYQCPAGNLSTGNKRMFRSDGMCQEIVKLYLDLKRDEEEKRALKKQRLEAEEELRSSKPNIVVYLGTVCNENCSYCDREYITESIGDQKLSRDDTYAMISYIEKIMPPDDPFIVFHGGEPFLYTDQMATIMEYFIPKYPEIKFSILTNATLLDRYPKKIKDFMSRYGKRIRIAISYDFNSTKKNRGYEINIKRALNNIRSTGADINQLQWVIDTKDKNTFGMENLAEISDLYTNYPIGMLCLIPMRHHRGSKNFKTVIEDVNLPAFFKGFLQFIQMMYVWNIRLSIDGEGHGIQKTYFNNHKQIILSPDGNIYSEFDFLDYKIDEAKIGSWKEDWIKRSDPDKDYQLTYESCHSCPQFGNCGLKYLYKINDVTPPGDVCRQFYTLQAATTEHYRRLSKYNNLVEAVK